MYPFTVLTMHDLNIQPWYVFFKGLFKVFYKKFTFIGCSQRFFLILQCPQVVENALRELPLGQA